MNSKRKADLQRKLSLAPVPRPPAELLDRIKNDIPEYLRPDLDGRRMRRSVAFNLRIAASILIAVSAVITAVYVLTPEPNSQMAATTEAPSMLRQLEDPAKVATDEVEVEITESLPVEQPAVQVAEATTAAEPFGYAAAPAALRRQEAPAAGGSAAPALMADATLDAAAEAAPVPPPPTPVPPPAAAPAPAVAQPTAAVAEAAPVTAKAEDRAERDRPASARLAMPSLVPEAYAAEPERVSRDQVFGISVDPAVFHSIKAALERNQRPNANAVNLAALVNYFAGAPAKPPKKGVRLELEGSPSPIGGTAQRGFLRFTVDTAEADSQLPLGADATLSIDFNSKVVERAEAVGDATTLTPEQALMHNVSVTGLYELTLRPNLRASDRVATVRLNYTRTTDGKKQTIEKAVYARDFARTWTRATRRHRLASLGAVWGQSLKAASPAPEVLRRAEELASQEPDDERAKELATAATASSKLTNGF